MYTQHEALARAQSLTRLGEAPEAQHRYELALARRLARKAAEGAEKAGFRLRLGLARRL